MIKTNFMIFYGITCTSDSMYLCNTNIVFDPTTTLSKGRSDFVNYIIQNKTFYRSQHPFVSSVAFGTTKSIEKFVRNSKHGYGYGTIYDNMVKNNFYIVSIDMPIRTCTWIHHSEYLANVPYRNIKLFSHKVFDAELNKVEQDFWCLNVV